MSNTLKFGNGQWGTKVGSALAYNDLDGNFKPLPFDFTRSTSATRINKDGLIEVVTNNKPRIDFKDDAKGALLLEPQRSNLITYSEDFSNSAWNTSSTRGVNFIPTSTIDPQGKTNAYRITSTASDNQVAYLAAIVLGVSYSSSIYVKRVSGSGDVILRNVNNVENNFQVSVNDGWKRLETSVLSTSTNGRLYINLQTVGDVIEIWGAQLEQGSYATSYIPTQGSAVTRVADVCSGAGNDQVFNDSEGVVYVETQSFIDGDFTSLYISLSDNTTGNNFITIQHRNNGQLRVYADNFSTIIFLQNIDMSENLKIALQYENITDFKLYVNGISYPIYSTPTNSAFVGLNTFDFKLKGSASGYWLGKVKEAKYFNTALTDAELISLTQ